MASLTMMMMIVPFAVLLILGGGHAEVAKSGTTLQYFVDIYNLTGVQVLDPLSEVVITSYKDPKVALTISGSEVLTTPFTGAKDQLIRLVPGAGPEGTFALYFSNGLCLGATERPVMVTTEEPRWCQEKLAFQWYFNYIKSETDDSILYIYNADRSFKLVAEEAGKPVWAKDISSDPNTGNWNVCNPDGTRCYH